MFSSYSARAFLHSGRTRDAFIQAFACLCQGRPRVRARTRCLTMVCGDPSRRSQAGLSCASMYLAKCLCIRRGRQVQINPISASSWYTRCPSKPQGGCLAKFHSPAAPQKSSFSEESPFRGKKGELASGSKKGSGLVCWISKWLFRAAC